MKSRSKVITGSILVLVGASSLLGNLQVINENFMLPILGAAFLVGYILLGGRKNYRNIGLLIPGIIFLALQILKVADDYKVEESRMILLVFGVLAVSFLTIYLIHSFWFKNLKKGQRNWPLYVSIILIVFGGFAYTAEYLHWSFGLMVLGNLWPAVLVLIGVRLLYKASKEKKEENNETIDKYGQKIKELIK